MPGRGQANIGIWPKSSGYSRCPRHFTWNAKATIVTFCSDFVVRECLHSLFATTLFFPFSEENKTLVETTPSLFSDTSLTNGDGSSAEKSSLMELEPVLQMLCSRHEMRARNGVTISPGTYITTIVWHMPLTNVSSLFTAPLPYGTCTFEKCIILHPHDKHTVASLARQTWTAHWALLYGPICCLHPPTMHAHCTRITSCGCYGRRERDNGHELARLPKPLQKVPVRHLALHVMPR